MQSVHSITKFVSLNPAHGEVYSIQDYMIKFVSDLRQIVDAEIVHMFEIHVLLKISLKMSGYSDYHFGAMFFLPPYREESLNNNKNNP
jgi:hypothetical protein